VVTNYAFGTSRLSYSTAQVFFAGIIDGRDVLFLFGDVSQEHEASLILSGTPNMLTSESSMLSVKKSKTSRHSIASFLPGIRGLVTVWDSSTQLVLYSDTETAATFWSPIITGATEEPFANYYQFGTNETILVGGPYLVRDATAFGTHLALRGDLKDAVFLTVIAPKSYRTISWNGEPVDTMFTSTIGYATIGRAHIQAGISIPQLTNWKFADSLPEISAGFVDDTWTIANHTKTNIPISMKYGDGRVLYGCDYGLCVLSFAIDYILIIYLAVRISFFGEVIFMARRASNQSI
jgi:hypothetical protein